MGTCLVRLNARLILIRVLIFLSARLCERERETDREKERCDYDHHEQHISFPHQWQITTKRNLRWREKMSFALARVGRRSLSHSLTFSLVTSIPCAFPSRSNYREAWETAKIGLLRLMRERRSVRVCRSAASLNLWIPMPCSFVYLDADPVHRIMLPNEFPVVDHLDCFSFDLSPRRRFADYPSHWRAIRSRPSIAEQRSTRPSSGSHCHRWDQSSARRAVPWLVHIDTPSE